MTRILALAFPPYAAAFWLNHFLRPTSKRDR